jgi:hypothetical protein
MHACCKHMFQVFLGFSYVCLQVFNRDVVYVCNYFQMFFRRFRKCFIRLFQVFYLSFFLYVVSITSRCFKTDRVFTWDARGEAASGMEDIRDDV